MTAVAIEIALVVSVLFFYELVDIIPLLILIVASKNDTAVEEYSCVKLMFGRVLLAFSRKVSIPCGQIRKMSSIYLK